MTHRAPRIDDRAPLKEDPPCHPACASTGVIPGVHATRQCLRRGAMRTHSARPCGRSGPWHWWCSRRRPVTGVDVGLEPVCGGQLLEETAELLAFSLVETGHELDLVCGGELA